MILYISVAVLSVLVGTKIMSKPAMIYNNINNDSRQSVVNRICLAGLFTLLFLVAALRIATGNDYYTYISHFHDIYYGIYTVTEEGFNYIAAFIYWFFNSECYLIVFALFAGLTVYLFLKGIYEQSSDFVLSLFLYMTLGLYFQCFNTVRYYFALSIVFVGMKYVVKRDYPKFILMILIAALFHKTALITIPLFIIARLPWKKWQVALVSMVCLVAPFFKNQIITIILKLYPSYRYEEEYLAAGGLSVVNILRCLLIFGICILFYKDAIKDNETNRLYFYLNYGALICYSCFYFIPFVSRLGYYLNISNILLIPAIVCSIKDSNKKNIFKALVIIGGILYFAFFLREAYGDFVKILPYDTWLTKPIEFIPLEKAIYK